MNLPNSIRSLVVVVLILGNATALAWGLIVRTHAADPVTFAPAAVAPMAEQSPPGSSSMRHFRSRWLGASSSSGIERRN